MVPRQHTDQLRCGPEPLGEINVLSGGGLVAAWVVVDVM